MKKPVSAIAELSEDIKWLPVTLKVALSSTVSPLAKEDAQFFQVAASYFIKTTTAESKGELNDIRSELNQLIITDQKKWFPILNKKLEYFKINQQLSSQKNLTPAIMIALGAAYDPDEKSAQTIYGNLKNAKLGNAFKWNSASENLAQIACRENLLRLLKFLLENRIFKYEEMFLPKDKTSPASIAESLGLDDITQYLEEFAIPKKEMRYRFSYTKDGDTNTDLQKSLLSDLSFELQPVDTSKNLN